MNDTRNKKDKNQHIQVFVRIRPTNNVEKASKSPMVVEASSNKDIVVRERPQDKLTKKFSFDKVFGPASKQIDVYNAVVSPLLEEVLAGYNCTVFAYGQTGTGKTFTMEGSCNDPSVHWQCDSMAGIIPRALSHLFEELRTLGAQEYSVRVSFLELYNEELFDLLSPSDESSKIRIYEDATRKGAIIIHGLEEVTVHNKSEVYKILEKGSEKRQTAATLMNAHSSRSHTVFSITVHIKENTVDGEELLKTGKLNLVDLAGSENVGRSGAVDRRAREAGNINQSLLTLGRVITALVERAPHVPYRESKLTRLLQESLGGRTKTSIIATVSPANMNIEETLSTLDYAHRAKNITNRPEINQKLSKKALLKEYTEEIERLRRDLLATRERNGVYLAQENYNEMQTLIEIQSKEIEEKINHIKALEEAMQNKEKLFTDLKVEYESTANSLHQTKEKLESTKNDLLNTKNKLSETAYDRELQKHLVTKHVVAEKTLLNQAETLLNVAEVATNDTQKLHEKIHRKQKVEEENENLSQQFRQEMLHRFQHIEEDLNNYAKEILNFCTSFKNQINCTAAYQNQGIDTAIKHISNDLTHQEVVISGKLTKNIHNTYDEYHTWILTQMEKASDMTQHEHRALQNALVKICPKIRELVDNKISENLKIFHKDTNSKLLNIVNILKNSVDDICNSLLIDRDNLTKQVEEIKGMVEVTVESQNKIAQNDHKFSKVFFDLKRQFESTWKQYEDFTIENSQSQSVISNKLNEIRIKSNNINETSLNNFDKNVEQEKLIKKQSEAQVEVIKKDLSSVLEENWSIAENAIAKSVDLISELEEDLNTCQEGLISYNNLVETNTKEQQDKINKHKETMLLKVEEYHKMILEASTNHTRFMEEQRNVTHSNYSEMNFNLERHAVESSEQKNKIANGLHSTHCKVEKFISEELRHDIPTGSTPARRDFSFPRHLVATSPHERIIKRFRDAQKDVDFSEDEDNTLIHGNNTITDILSPCINGRDSNGLSSPVSSKNHVKCSTPYSESKIKKPILYNNSHNLIKSASTSDIPHTAKTQLDSTCTSESGIVKGLENKENGDEEFIKPSKLKPKRLSKVKSASRKALGSFN